MSAEDILTRGIVRAAGFGPGTRASLLVEQGSDRLFYRLRLGERDAVLMVSPRNDPDFPRYVEIGRYLHRMGLGAPEIHETDPETCSLVMEDLGDETLYAVASRATDVRALAARYRAVLTLLARLQVETRDTLADCPSAAERALDMKRLRWETDYFRENFLQGECGLSAERTSALTDEFERLAAAVEREQPPGPLIHRDFQSMNIMFKDAMVRVVDFQGARRGGCAYDLASLLKDAYVDFPATLRGELLEFFRRELVSRSGAALEREALARAFLLAGLQRNMQALGAFSFLTRVKKKRGFRRFIAPCLRRLREGLDELDAPPGPLTELARICAALETAPEKAF
ncbi:MAG: phosphotransferase [Elusimicrobiota bacterium]